MGFFDGLLVQYSTQSGTFPVPCLLTCCGSQLQLRTSNFKDLILARRYGGVPHPPCCVQAPSQGSSSFFPDVGRTLMDNVFQHSQRQYPGRDIRKRVKKREISRYPRTANLCELRQKTPLATLGLQDRGASAVHVCTPLRGNPKKDRTPTGLASQVVGTPPVAPIRHRLALLQRPEACWSTERYPTFD